MKTSVFGWLDYSDNERAQMTEILNLFREKGTQDELGAAQIRDALSDRFFAGTTTVQTRARYFLFVPWIQFEIERANIPASQRDSHHRALHARLVDSLQAGGESSGIIGVVARQTLRNLPNGIYWTGLNAWGIRLAGESIERYSELRLNSRTNDDDEPISESGELITQERRYWHPGIPAPPDDLFEATTFDLTRDEAEFLQERIIESRPGTLLEGCLSQQISNIESARFPWELDGLDSLNETLQIDIEHARRFALLAEGAVILYNLMLAERAVEWNIGQHEERAEQYREQFHEWAGEIASESNTLRNWDRQAFWTRMRELRATLRPATEHFFDHWMEMAIPDPQALASSQAAQSLISQRERSLKGRLARLHFRDPLQRWSGASGLGRMTYRWPSARSHLIDILKGLNRVPETAHA
jgi:hypothetical protein